MKQPQVKVKGNLEKLHLRKLQEAKPLMLMVENKHLPTRLKAKLKKVNLLTRLKVTLRHKAKILILLIMRRKTLCMLT